MLAVTGRHHRNKIDCLKKALNVEMTEVSIKHPFVLPKLH